MNQDMIVGNKLDFLVVHMGENRKMRGVFVVIEGLTGVGKSTAASDLAEVLDMEYVPVFPTEYKMAQDSIENDPAALDARFALFFSGLMVSARRINDLLDAGEMVVVDSWIYRTIATHSAMGSKLSLKTPSWFPEPDIKILLTCDEEVRKLRIASRGRHSGYWKAKCEEHSDEIMASYRKQMKKLIEVSVDPPKVDPTKVIIDDNKSPEQRSKEKMLNELLSKVRPVVKKARDSAKAMEVPESRKFLSADLVWLDQQIAENQEQIRLAKELGQESTEQSSESWHDNYNFEESQRQLKMLLNNLGRLSNAREKAEVVIPASPIDTAGVGCAVKTKAVDTGVERELHIGSFMVSDRLRNMGMMSYESPAVSDLVGKRVGDSARVRTDDGDITVEIIGISVSGLPSSEVS
jgi:thymidylate kinase/transcription elongation GreA/GreB family factor